MAKVVVFGAGYVGLVQAAGLAAIGHDVVLIDVDSKKLALLQEGKVPFYEPGLEELLEDVRLQKTLRFHDSSAAPCTVDVAGAELIFVAVGTPPMPDGSADTSQIMAVVGQVAEILACTTTPPWHQAVVIKSTVPPGTAALVRERLPRTVAVLSNPEFLREGQAVYDFFHPDRVVIGCSDSDIVPARSLAALYGASHPPRSIQRCTVLITSNCSAELIKYASNTMLAMRISFANEVAQVCEALDADVRDVTRGMGLDRRIGPAFLEAGCSYGGSCFPKDIAAFDDVARSAGIVAHLARATMQVNQIQRATLVKKLLRHFTPGKPKKVAVWGLAFKPETDDIRDSPALDIILELLQAGIEVTAYDPKAPIPAVVSHFERLRADGPAVLRVVTRIEDSLVGAEALVVCTAWPEFRARQELIAPAGVQLVVDGRNLLNWIELRAAGVTYVPVGRAPLLPRAVAATGT